MIRSNTSSGCIFCNIINGKAPCWKVYEDNLVIAFFDIHPEAEGHILVVPKKHFKDIFDVEEKYIKRAAVVCKRLSLALNKALGIKDINIIHGSGKNAQQDVFHFHMHIWPRRKGDTIKLQYVPQKGIPPRFDILLERIKKYIPQPNN
ncbi:MAG TPA: HIT domain-containing protein [Nanoarchaeota archaeon]|nr:HIT domain-containing protein [Nanoarchaeota archaeon]